MPKVLVFTYYWPPSGGPAVQRWLSLADLLLKEGIEPIVITVDEASASYTLKDNSLNNRIPSDLRVIKTKSFEILHFYQKLLSGGDLPTAGFANESDPSLFQKLARWIRGNFFFPDPRKGWNQFALNAARQLLEKEDIKGVITAGPPQSTHLIGAQLKKEYDLFWLCDFHDAWTNVWYYDELKRTQIAKSIDRNMELSVLRDCDLIITVGQQILDDFVAKTGQPEKVNLHSMGYDEVLFDTAIEPVEEFVITYSGTMADNYEPGSFFKAVKQLVEERPDWNLKIRLVGLISDGIHDQIKSVGLEQKTEITGYLPHGRAIDLLRSSSLLLLVSPNTPGSEMIIPGKIYEYMASRIPILNLSTQHSETAQILTDCEAGVTFERNEIEEIRNYISSTYQSWLSNPKKLLNTTDHFKKYSRQTEAKILAQTLLSRLNP